jgi:hypothetical protein
MLYLNVGHLRCVVEFDMGFSHRNSSRQFANPNSPAWKLHVLLDVGLCMHKLPGLYLSLN